MNEVLDLIIVGAGPAGMTAAVYASRGQLDFIVLEQAFPGGQITNTYEVENYTGIKHISGFDLAMQMKEHAEALGSQFVTEAVMDMKLEDDIKEVVTATKTYRAKSIILATGARWRHMGATGEDTFAGKGVSYCATCDGAFYRDKVTLVVGGGDVAVEDAIYLARMCKKVYLVHRRDELRAVKVLQERLLALDNVEVLWSHELREIQGGDFVDKVIVENGKTNQQKELAVDGVFIAIGSDPNTEFIKGKVAMDNSGYIITNEACETNISGVFAAGDLRVKTLRQIITACGDGATAVHGVEKYV